MSFAEDDEEQGLPDLGKEPIAVRLRRFALALVFAVGIVAAFVGLIILTIALALPWMRDTEEEDSPSSVVIPRSEDGVSPSD